MLKWRSQEPGDDFRWPYEISNVPDLLAVVKLGFEFVIWLNQNDQPVYRLRRNGKISPWGTMSPSVGQTAHVRRGYFECLPREVDGTVPMRLRETRGARKPRKETP